MRFRIKKDMASMSTDVRQTHVDFLMASSLYHPDTVERSLRHDGSGDEPGLKDPEGNWDLRPHRQRIIHVTDQTLQTWHAIMEDDSIPVRQTRMVYTVNTAAAEVLATLARQPRVSSLESRVLTWLARDRPTARRATSSPDGALPKSWDDVILQGPHLYVATPMYKSPNPTMKHNTDWSATDFEVLPADAIPVTAYKPAGEPGPVRRRLHALGVWARAVRITGSLGGRWQRTRDERTLIPR